MQKKIYDYSDHIYKKNGYSDLTRKLEKLLCQEAELLLRRSGQLFPPFDPLRIRRGNLRLELKMSSKRNAHIPTKEGFRIEIMDKEAHDLDDLSARARTTIAHEIGHTFFYDINESPPRHIGVVSSRKSQWALENMCFAIGRTLLMPEFSISQLLVRNPSLGKPSFSKLQVLRNIYKVSSDIVAWRMIKDLKIWRSCFLKNEVIEENEEKKFKQICFPLRNSDDKGLNLIKLKRVIDRKHELYSHLLRALDLGRRVEDIASIENVHLLLESKKVTEKEKFIVITTLISVRDYQTDFAWKNMKKE